MPLNFGPLTAKGGERRLNVAVTRARRKVIVVSSFDPSELASANSVGMVHLREYLEMAKAVSSGRRPETVRLGDANENVHQQAIVDALGARDLVVQSNVGLSSFRVDIAVTVPEQSDRWLVGILLDGTAWAGRLLASDRDALPVTILEGKMGWRKVVRVWLPSWRTEADDIIQEIEALVRRLAAEPEPDEPDPDEIESSVETVGQTPDRPAQERVSDVARSDASAVAVVPATSRERRDFVPIPKPSVVGNLDDLQSDRSRGIDMINRLADDYGPVSKSLVIKATLNAFGLGVIREERLRQFADLVDSSRLVVTPFGEFVFPAALVEAGEVRRSDFDWYRSSKFSDRTLDEISPHEFANCAVVLVRAGFSISEDELVQECLNEFGYLRKTEDARKLARDRISWAVSAGYLVQDGITLRVAG